MRRAVVVTGVGVVSAFGVGWPAFAQGLSEGRSAVGPIRSFDASTFATQVAGEVTGALDSAWLQTHLLPWKPASGPGRTAWEAQVAHGAWRDRKVVFGWSAALEAWRHARCGAAEAEAGLVMGLGLEQAFLEDVAPLFYDHRIHWLAGNEGPGLRFRSEVDLCAQAVMGVLDLQGQCVVNASACAAGGLAVAQAASLIERGAASIVLCGGADSMVNPFGLGGMSRLGAPSPRAALDACRPFDQGRDGLVIGEGAAMLVLESQERAQRRGVQPLARVLGSGSSQDGYRATAPRPDGAAAVRAIRQALQQAGLAPEQIGHVNAHGTGTPLNDVAEARALRTTFGDHADRLPVSSIKGAVGHLMAAAGAIEAVACLLPLCHNLVPGTAHHRHKDPACDIRVVGEQPETAQVAAVLSNSFGFGGQNVSLVFGRADGRDFSAR
ncbi:MAG: beta-ketoacyl-[acyl-carrier-protein] synthase family protein [Pseudomonadota bacterium]